MASDEILWRIEEHTRAKHRILRGYLDAWLPIIGSQFPGMNLIDGFAGPGEYENGEPGSPIIMLDSLIDHASLPRITAETTFTFIEQDERRIAHLRTLVDARKDRIPAHVSVDIIPGRYEDHIETVLTRLGNDPQRPTFAFIDPFGYSSADMADNGRILRVADRCEVLMFVPLSHVARFVGRPGQDNAMTGLFGNEEWRNAIPLDGDERKALLHDLFVKQLQQAGKLPYVRSFEIRTSHRRALSRRVTALQPRRPRPQAQGAGALRVSSVRIVRSTEDDRGRASRRCGLRGTKVQTFGNHENNGQWRTVGYLNCNYTATREVWFDMFYMYKSTGSDAAQPVWTGEQSPVFSRRFRGTHKFAHNWSADAEITFNTLCDSYDKFYSVMKWRLAGTSGHDGTKVESAYFIPDCTGDGT